MSYNNIVEAQRKWDAKDTTHGVLAKRGRGRPRKNPAPKPAEPKRQRQSELNVAEDEIKTMGLQEYCSLLQL